MSDPNDDSYPDMDAIRETHNERRPNAVITSLLLVALSPASTLAGCGWVAESSEQAAAAPTSAKSAAKARVEMRMMKRASK